MKLLVSVINAYEAQQALLGGAQIIDIKNPAEGALGASLPWRISRIKQLVSNSAQLSATLGDFDYKPGTACLALVGAAGYGLDYLKLGIKFNTRSELRDFAAKLRAALKPYRSKLVLVGYADYRRIGSICPLEMPQVLRDLCDYLMIDTYIKDGTSSLDHLSLDQLAEFSLGCRRNGLRSALAGGLNPEIIPKIAGLGFDVIGVRRCCCSNGRLDSSKVAQLRRLLWELDSGQV